MNTEALGAWFESLTLHTYMVEIFWLFPLMETLHFIGLSFLFGALLVVDFRVIGLIKFINMKESMKYIPVAIIAFAVNLISGFCFLSADPMAYLDNIGFQWKMAMIAVAGVNALWFWFGEHTELSRLADGEDAPFRAKVIALVSILVWIVVIVLGRMIPYTDF